MLRKTLLILPLLTSFAVLAASLDSLKNYYAKASTSAEKCDYLLLISSEFKSSNLDSALFYGLLANQLSLETSPKQQQRSLYNLAQINKQKGNYALGKEQALLSLKISDSVNDANGSGEANLILAHCSALLKEYDNSILYYEKCIDLFKLNGNVKGLAYAHIGIGNVYYYQDEMDDAKYHLSTSIKYLDSIKDFSGKAATLVSLGSMSLTEEDYKNAVIYYKLGFDLYGQTDRDGLKSLVAYNLGDCYRIMGEYVKAEKYMKLCLQYAVSGGSQEDVKYAYQGMTNLSEDMGNFKEALRFNNLFHELKDSLNQINSEGQIKRIEAEYGKKLTQEKLSLTESELTLKAEKLKETQGYVWLLIIGGNLLILSSISFFVIWRKSKKKNEVLSLQSKNIREQNEIIDSSLKEKDLLLKEVHHRVKNNLQMISSLLNLQMGSLKSKSAIKALEESKNRVQAIALLHKSLYQDNNLAKVNLREYIADLISYYRQMSPLKKRQVEFNLSVIEKEINLDTAVPFGLIISELISNSNEHAFNEVIDYPEITIVISQSSNNQMRLTYSDNGVGLDNDYNLDSDTSLGIEIIKALVEQLDGDLNSESIDGATFTINITEQSS